MRKLAPLLATALLLLPPRPAHAQIVPVSDERVIRASAHGYGLTRTDEKSPAAPFAWFYEFAGATVDNPDPDGAGFVDAGAYQLSQILTFAISASGNVNGEWQIWPGSESALSQARFRFRLDVTSQYSLDVWLEPGEFPGRTWFSLGVPGASTFYHHLEDGELHVTGVLAPGDYVIEGVASMETSLEQPQGGTYTYQFIATPLANPIVDQQPADVQFADCGNAAGFTVTTHPPASGLTFQWRRNLEPLADGGNVSGAHTPSLQLASTCDADAGWYDVVVSDGTNTETSRAAHLRIGGTSAVGDPPASPRGLALEMAGPNPARGTAAVRWTVPGAQRTRLAVYDVTGARIRTLADRVLEGSGVATWDGSTDAGGRARPGLYFVRAEGGTQVARRALVLLD